MTEPREKTWRDSLPFPAHWLGYIVVKIVVLALAVYLVLRWKGFV